MQNLGSEPHLKEALTQAGFTNITIVKESKVFSHDTQEAWWDSLWTHAIRAQLEQLSSADLESLKREAFSKLGDGPVKDQRNAILALATRMEL
ncbi:MAG: hypothetical protein JSR46_12300 [Verrucomicrobia bacterium]|nr:hypothetical protein [Verrucomicrobiota bacterium]